MLVSSADGRPLSPRDRRRRRALEANEHSDPSIKPSSPRDRRGRRALEADEQLDASIQASSSTPLPLEAKHSTGNFYGHVKFWIANRAFGFIRPDDVHTEVLDSRDVYVHIRHTHAERQTRGFKDMGYLNVGSRVRFWVELEVDGRPAAKDVETVLDDAGR